MTDSNDKLWEVNITVTDPAGETQASITGKYLGPEKAGQLFLIVTQLMGGPDKVKELVQAATEELSLMDGGADDPLSVN